MYHWIHRRWNELFKYVFLSFVSLFLYPSPTSSVGGVKRFSISCTCNVDTSNFFIQYDYFYVIFLFLSDVNECDIFPCTNNAKCQDTDGSFECSCVSGYSGDGYVNCTGL